MLGARENCSRGSRTRKDPGSLAVPAGHAPVPRGGHIKTGLAPLHGHL